MAEDFQLMTQKPNGIRAVLHLTGEEVGLLVANLPPRVEDLDPEEVERLRIKLIRWLGGLK